MPIGGNKIHCYSEPNDPKHDPHMEDALDAYAAVRLGGMDVPSDISKLETTAEKYRPEEDDDRDEGDLDPLMTEGVILGDNMANFYELFKKHNALVREFREMTQYRLDNMCRLEGKIEQHLANLEKQVANIIVLQTEIATTLYGPAKTEGKRVEIEEG